MSYIWFGDDDDDAKVRRQFSSNQCDTQVSFGYTYILEDVTLNWIQYTKSTMVLKGLKFQFHCLDDH
jgi:hypothetical protein